jgi:uncharacterized membrane protein YcaP (DUF421 family)
MFFDNWSDLWRVAAVGTLSYAALIVLLRTSGKRTLSKWNAFDFVVTIALGSTLATVLLSEDVSYAEGVLGLALLVVLQLVISRLAVHSRVLRRYIKAEPRLLFDRGNFLAQTMKSERVTESEVRAAARRAGFGGMEHVDAIVLETDGSVSVIGKAMAADRSALCDVRR